MPDRFESLKMGGRFDPFPTKKALVEALAEKYLSWGIQQGNRFIRVRFSKPMIPKTRYWNLS